MTTTAITADDIIKRYAANIAYVAEQSPATDLDAFIDQLETATIRFDRAGINGHEELETVRIFLAEALYNTDDDTERTVFLRKADERLEPLRDMTDEYRGMAGTTKTPRKR